MIDRLELHTKAQEVRELLGEDANSPVDIFALASQIRDLTWVYYPLGSNISGMCVKNEKIKLIAVNSTMSYGRQRFSFAHELYHLYYDRSSGYNVCSKTFEPSDEVEKNADQFASYFIAPYKALREKIRKIRTEERLSLRNVIELEQYFGMSHQAMLWRLVSEKYLTKKEMDGYSIRVIMRAKELGYDDRLYRPLPEGSQKRTYGYYLKQVESLRKKEQVSSGKIDELLLDAYRDDIVFGDDAAMGGELFD